MRPVVLAAMALLAACGGADTTAPEAHEAPDTGDATAAAVPVVWVADGDTLDVELDGREERVRLIGIDAPERGGCLAAEATDALRDLVEGEAVVLEADTSDRDRHDRLLRYVHVGGTHVNAALVRDGFAVARRYPPDTARADELEAAEEAARAGARGVWGREDCRP